MLVEAGGKFPRGGTAAENMRDSVTFV